ncbi:MAG: response regulator [Sedimentisphaerales bacterium]|nr:response regulator [Sedimentisphaerales bacterium]
MFEKKYKVLVVDDEVHILHVIALKLRNGGYEIITARDGREALELAQVELPDLIITDYQMPYLSGLELCQRLRQIPATRHIPAIMLTARGFNLEETALRSAGIEICINKPFGPRDLLCTVNEIINPEPIQTE